MTDPAGGFRVDAPQPEKSRQEEAPHVDYFVVGICDLCRTGVPGQCYVPGCMFWMCDAPALPYVQKLTILPAKFEFNEGWNRG